MAKFKTSMQKKDRDLVSHDVPLPESAWPAIREGALQAVQIRFSRAILEKAGKITDHLLISRRIDEEEIINPNHPHVMLLAVANKDLEVDDVIYAVQKYHRKWAREAQRDAGFIALTMLTKLKDVDPLPYAESDLAGDAVIEEGEEEDELEEWERSAKLIVPPTPVRNLNHPYERRLKQFLDMLDLCDTVYQIKIGKLLSEIFTAAVRNFGAGDVSEDNFQSSILGGGTDNPSVAKAGKNGNA